MSFPVFTVYENKLTDDTSVIVSNTSGEFDTSIHFLDSDSECLNWGLSAVGLEAIVSNKIPPKDQRLTGLEIQK